MLIFIFFIKQENRINLWINIKHKHILTLKNLLASNWNCLEMIQNQNQNRALNLNLQLKH